VLERVVAGGAFENRQYALLPDGREPGDEELVSIVCGGRCSRMSAG